MRLRLFALLCVPLLTGCDMLYDVLDVPRPEQRAATLEAEGRAIGGGCRHSGRALEDCYALNQGVSKAAIFEGWRAMNDYMRENHLTEVQPRIPAQKDRGPVSPAPKPADSTSPSPQTLPLASP